MVAKSSETKKTTKPKAKAKAKTSSTVALPTEGSAARKAMILRGEIEE